MEIPSLSPTWSKTGYIVSTTTEDKLGPKWSLLPKQIPPTFLLCRCSFVTKLNKPSRPVWYVPTMIWLSHALKQHLIRISGCTTETILITYGEEQTLTVTARRVMRSSQLNTSVPPTLTSRAVITGVNVQPLRPVRITR